MRRPAPLDWRNDVASATLLPQTIKARRRQAAQNIAEAIDSARLIDSRFGHQSISNGSVANPDQRRSYFYIHACTLQLMTPQRRTVRASMVAERADFQR